MISTMAAKASSPGIVEEFNTFQMAVILSANFDLKAIQVSLERDGLIDFELAEKKW